MSTDLLPTASSSEFEVAQSETSARLLALPVSTIARERQPANCDAAFLSALAWERSVHYWAPGDDAGNRARVASSFQDHANYGSPAALELEIALDTAQTVQIVEFFEEKSGVWPDFAVESVVTVPVETPPDIDALMASAVKRSNVRDWPFPRLRVIQPPTVVNVGAAQRIGISMDATRPAPQAPFIGAAQRIASTTRVPPL
jgi:phage tail P2-like protein